MERNYPQDVEQYRKARNKKTLIRRLVVLAVLLAFSVAIALGSDLISDLYGLVGTKFPLSFSGERLQKFVHTKNSFIAVCEQQYIIFDDSGERIAAAPHGFANPQISFDGTWAALYEPSGSNITLIENKKEILQKSFTDKVIFADVSQSGTFGAITTDRRYLSAFSAYDKGGKEKFRYSSADQLTSVKFAPDGKRAVLAALRSDGGILQTVVTGINFNKEEPKFTFNVENSVCLGIYKTANAWGLLCDNKILFFDDNGKILSEYALAEKPISWAASDSGVIAVAVWDQGAYKIVTYSKDKVTESSAVSDEPKAIAVSGDVAYAVSDHDAYEFDKSGKEKRRVALTTQVSGIVAVKGSLFAINDYQVSQIKF
jgi:hypothetical protein